jgi:hypothetical protein
MQKDLNRLEKLLASGKLLAEQPFTYGNQLKGPAFRAIRTTDGTLNTRTHNVQINGTNLWWENGNSREWEHIFETLEQAGTWWNKHVATVLESVATLSH